MGFRSPEQRRAVMAALRDQQAPGGGPAWGPPATIGEVQGRYRDMRETAERLESPEQLRRLREMGETMITQTGDLGPRGARAARREQARLAADIERRLRKIEKSRAESRLDFIQRYEMSRDSEVLAGAEKGFPYAVAERNKRGLGES